MTAGPSGSGPSGPAGPEGVHGRLGRTFIGILIAEVLSIAVLYWIGVHFAA
jgi:hypothetical protein